MIEKTSEPDSGRAKRLEWSDLKFKIFHRACGLELDWLRHFAPFSWQMLASGAESGSWGVTLTLNSLEHIQVQVHSIERASASLALLGSLKTEAKRVLITALSSPLFFFQSATLPSTELWSVIQKPELISPNYPPVRLWAPLISTWSWAWATRCCQDIITQLSSQAAGSKGAFASRDTSL